MRSYHHDACQSRHAAADLLRWSMGSEMRYGNEYCEYQEPPNPAQKPVSARDVAGAAGWYTRYLSLSAVAAFLRWVLSVTEPRKDRDS
jgi:hypothetical protein